MGIMSAWTKEDHITKAKDGVVSSLRRVWTVSILDLGSKEEEKKYLSALAETYQNAASWGIIFFAIIDMNATFLELFN